MAVRTLDELTDLEKLALIPLSYSRLNTFHEMCQAMYYYQYIIKEEEEFAIYAVLGNIIHSVLEEEVQPDTPVVQDDLETLLAQYVEQREAWDPDHIIPQELIDAGQQMIIDFVDRHEGETFRVEEKEKAFEIVVGRAHIRGFIDRVDIDDDIVTITDYKTGKREVAAKNAHKDLQLGIYALAMQHEFPDKKIYAQLYYLRSGRQKGHLFTKDDLDAVESRIIQLTNFLIETENFRPTDNFRICSFCSYAKTGVCPHAPSRYRR